MDKLRLKFYAAIVFLASIALYLTAVSGSQAKNDDAIAVRIYNNPEQISAEQWYANSGLKGSPQTMLIDGYRAVRDGNTAFVNVGELIGGAIHTKIFVLSYTRQSGREFSNIFGQILDHMKFNSDLAASGVCRNHNMRTGLEGGQGCLADSECAAGAFCTSQKAMLARDVRRIEDKTDLLSSVNEYIGKNGVCPNLNSGTYVPYNTFSSWPSWQGGLGRQMGSVLPIDPINRFSNCLNPFSDRGLLASMDNAACVSETGSFSGSTRLRYHHGSKAIDITPPINLPFLSEELQAKIWPATDFLDQAIRYLTGSSQVFTPVSTDKRTQLYEFAERVDQKKYSDQTSLYKFWSTEDQKYCGFCFDFESEVDNQDACFAAKDTAAAGNARIKDDFDCSNLIAKPAAAFKEHFKVATAKGVRFGVSIQADWPEWNGSPFNVSVVNDNWVRLETSKAGNKVGSYPFVLTINDLVTHENIVKQCKLTIKNKLPVIDSLASSYRVMQGHDFAAITIKASQAVTAALPLSFNLSTTLNGTDDVNQDSDPTNDFPNSGSKAYFSTGDSWVLGVEASKTEFKYAVPALRVDAWPHDPLPYELEVRVMDKTGAWSSNKSLIYVYNDPPAVMTQHLTVLASTTLYINHMAYRATDDPTNFPLHHVSVDKAYWAGLSDGTSSDAGGLQYWVRGRLQNQVDSLYVNTFDQESTPVAYQTVTKDNYGFIGSNNKQTSKSFMITVRNSGPYLDMSGCQAQDVKAHDMPPAAASRQSGYVECNVGISDYENNDIASLTVSGLPTGMTVQKSEGNKALKIFGEVTTAHIGIYDAVISATDEFGFRTHKIWRVNVQGWCGDDSEITDSCDDGWWINGTGVPFTPSAARCNSNCRTYCGNNLRDMDEACEGSLNIALSPHDSNPVLQYACSSLCRHTGGWCGDGNVSGTVNVQLAYGETCDDGNRSKDDGCDENCRTEEPDISMCTPLPDNAVANGPTTALVDQPNISHYGLDEDTCHFVCEPGFSWDGAGCVKCCIFDQSNIDSCTFCAS